MNTTSAIDRVTVAPADLERLLDLYARGLCVQAYRLAESFGPLRAWTGPGARVMAGRLALNLGAPRLGMLMHLRGWREDRSHPEACYYHARALLERRGPLTAYSFLRRQGDLSGAPANVHSDWLALHASLFARLRNFDAAEAWLDRAVRACPDQPWTSIERAFLFEMEDRYEESLAAARHALELRAWYRPAVQAAAHVLQLLGRDREALDLLVEGAERIESAPVLAQLFTLQTELGLYADARKSLDRFPELAPLSEKAIADWLAARRADNTYYLGDRATAAAFARQVGGPFYAGFAERLEQPSTEGRRVLLEVGFIRQHHQTCVPATLSAIGRFWNMPTDHLAVADAICYDGTPDHRERAWAEDNGWVTREFTVTWDAAVALLDRGIPFTLTTAEPGNAHMQAIIGYDTCRKTLLVRDPSQRIFSEFIADITLECYRSIGPRGMALVPRDRAHLLDGLDLPDAALYDRLHQLQRALFAHDRAHAAATYAELRALAPEHRLTLQARRSLALYDADPTEMLASMEELLALFPDDQLLLLGKLSRLRELGRRDDRLALLQSVCARPGSDPIFWRQLAQELFPDAREHSTARRLLQRCIRFRPFDPGSYAILANLVADQRHFEEAMELYGFAACLDDKDEGLARSYFSAARHLKRVEPTLRFLESRFRRHGTRSSQPARTLYWALGECERMPEALAVLDEALKQRPTDGDLLLFAAQARANQGHFDRAQELLAAAEGHSQRTGFLRTAANLAALRGDLAASLGLWRQVVEAEPLALDANRALTQLLAETDSRAAALAHLEAACARFPHHFALHQLWIGFLHEEGPAALETVVRRLLAIHPADAWAHRELALCLRDQGRLDDAFAELEHARQLEPTHVSYFCVLGQLCERAGRRVEAQQAYREAVRLSVDTDFAINRLVETCETQAERVDALAFVESELVRQVIFGDGLLAYQQHAQHFLEPRELLASLRRAHEARPDLWHAWSALVRQLTEMGMVDEARDLARQATERFPLSPASWFDLAIACRACHDAEGEGQALEHALQMRPSWGAALRRLAEVRERTGRAAEARTLLERAVAVAPLDAYNHGCLADALWQAGEKEAALDRLKHALRLEPGYDWAWSTLMEWSHVLEQPEAAAELARELTVRRPDEARSWLMLARVAQDDENLEERLRALEHTLKLNPRCLEAYDLKATLLCKASRAEEARSACLAPVWDDQVPLILRGRAAWVEAECGHFEAAIAGMRAALAEDPNYYWGWKNLAEWGRDHLPPGEYLEAADQRVRLAPDEPTGYGFRGEARLRTGDRTGAKADYRHALELAPTYGFAGIALFDEQMTDGELDDAAATLAVLKEHDGDDFIISREVQLAARRQDRTGACKGLRNLATSTSVDLTWPLENAVGAMLEAGWGADVEQTLGEALDADTAHPMIGSLWVDRWSSRQEWGCAERIDRLAERGEMGRRALIRTVYVLGKGRQAERVRACIARHAERLRGDVVGWGTVGYALTVLEDWRGAAAWLGDWDRRPDVQPWMLINLVIALRALGADADASRAGQGALALSADHTTPHHAVWLALDDAVAGKSAEAAGRLEGMEPEHFDRTHRFLHTLVSAVLGVQRASAGERGKAFDRVRQELAEAAKSCAPLEEDWQAVRRSYRRGMRRLGRDGGVRAWLWSRWRLLRPLLPAKMGSKV